MKRSVNLRIALSYGARGRSTIPMRMPPAHPFNPLQALRLIVAAGSNRQAVETVFDARIPARSRCEQIPTTIAELARHLNVADPEHVLHDATVKQKLRENTDWAIARGSFFGCQHS